jgi:hypothetical protein
VVYSTGAGEPNKLPTEGLAVQNDLNWLPDGKHVLLTAREKGRGPRLWLQEISGGKPRAISPEGYVASPRAISPDGKVAVVTGPDQKMYLYPLAGGEPQLVPGITGERHAGWSGDGLFLYVYRLGELPAKVFRVEIATGKRELWKTLMPADAAGISSITRVCPTSDGKSYAYTYFRTLSDLYLVEGMK